MYLVGDHVVYPELGVPVREAGGAGGHEGGGGGAAGVGVVHDEPVVVGVAVELRSDGPLEPVDYLAVLPGPARQTAG